MRDIRKFNRPKKARSHIDVRLLKHSIHNIDDLKAGRFRQEEFAKRSKALDNQRSLRAIAVKLKDAIRRLARNIRKETVTREGRSRLKSDP